MIAAFYVWYVYIYINHITILCMYTCSIQFDPPAGPFTPNCHFASCLLMWQYQRWRRRPGRVTPHGPHLVFRQHTCARVSCTITINKANMVHLWYSFCSFHLWCVEVGRVDSWFSVIHSWRILNPTQISGFKVDLPLSRHNQKKA